MDLIKWKQDLERDEKELSYLLDKANEITTERDYKLEVLKSKIAEKIENPLNEDNKKVIIFTTYADTATYLYKQLFC
jgi:ERCC4-related helicase